MIGNVSLENIDVPLILVVTAMLSIGGAAFVLGGIWHQLRRCITKVDRTNALVIKLDRRVCRIEGHMGVEQPEET